MYNRIEIAYEFAKAINSDDIVHIILFGSVARGDDGEESDIDILIISPIIDKLESRIDDEVVNVILDKNEFISAHLMSEDHFNQTIKLPLFIKCFKRRCKSCSVMMNWK